MARPRIKNLDQNIIHEVMALSYESGLSVLSTKKIASRLKGLRCGFKSTSCPDRFAAALEDAMKGTEDK